MIWLPEGRLEHLRRRMAAGDARLTALRAVGDANLQSTDSYRVSIENYALLYLLTQEAAYGAKAVELVMQLVGKGLGAITPDSGYWARQILPAMACAWDWLQPVFSASQRQQILTQVEEWGDWVFPETNPSRTGAWGTNAPGNNYWHGFMRLWILGLAFRKDTPKALKWVEICRKRWHETGKPYSDRFEVGGHLLDGTNYDKGALLFFLSAAEWETGEPLLTGWSWTDEFLRARLYLTTPNFKQLAPFGDQARESGAPLSWYDAVPAMIAAHFASPDVAGYGVQWLQLANFGSAFLWLMWQNVLFWPDQIAPVDYRQTLSPSYFAPAAGWFTQRSDWTVTAQQFHAVCGPMKQGAQDRAAGTYLWWRNGWLLGPARLNSQSGLLSSTPYHNALLLPPQHQPYGRPEPQPIWERTRTPRISSGKDWSYVCQEPGPAYAYYQWPGAAQPLRNYTRQQVWLQPDLLVVYDRLTASNPNTSAGWQLQALSAPQVAENGYVFERLGQVIHGKVFSPNRPVPVLQIDEIKEREETTPNGKQRITSSYRITTAATVGDGLEFLHALCVSDPATPRPEFAELSGVNYRGVQVGRQIVLFSATEAAMLSLEIDGPAQGAEILIANLEPGPYIFSWGPHRWQESADENGCLRLTLGALLSGTSWTVRLVSGLLEQPPVKPLPPAAEPEEPEEPAEPEAPLPNPQPPSEEEPGPDLPIEDPEPLPPAAEAVGAGTAALVLDGVAYEIAFEVKRK